MIFKLAAFAVMLPTEIKDVIIIICVFIIIIIIIITCVAVYIILLKTGLGILDF